MNYAEKLRAMAEWFEARPELLKLVTWSPSDSLYCSDATEFGKACRAIGEFEKSRYGNSLSANVNATDDDDNPIFYFYATVSGVCEAKPKLDENGNVVTQPKRKYVDTDETEPVMEYHCPDSWLNL